MKSILTLLLTMLAAHSTTLATALLLALLAAAPCAFAGVTLFPVPPSGVKASPHYRVEVQTPAGWQPSYVNFNPARTDGSGAGDQPGRSMSWTTLQTDVPVRVRVTASQWQADGVVVRPSRLGIAPEKTGERSVEFTLEPGRKVSVEFPGSIKPDCFTGPPHGIPCVMHALMIFADRAPVENPLASHAPGDITTLAPGLHAETLPVSGLPGRTAHRSTLGTAGGKRVVVFAPGVHDLGYWQVPNNVEHVHLAPGAVVFGALDVLPQGREPGAFDLNAIYRDAWPKETLRKEFKLTGHGILSGAKLPWHLKKDFSYHEQDHWWQHVKLVQLAVTNITLRDVTLVDAPYWCVSFLNDADARSRGVFENFKIVGAWTYNNDGLPVPGGAGSIVRDAFVHADDDALKLYHSGGRVEDCVVWQNNNGAVFQFGWFAKTVRDVRVRGVDVIHNENWYGVNQANRAVFNFADAGGRGVIEDVRFEDIAIEGKILRTFGFKPMGEQTLRDWHFKNVTVGAFGAGQIGGPGRNYFLGDISGFHFESFTVGDKAILAPEEGQFDFGSGAGGGFTFKASLTNEAAVSLAIRAPAAEPTARWNPRTTTWNANPHPAIGDWGFDRPGYPTGLYVQGVTVPDGEKVTNPVIYDNDVFDDVFDDELALVMASEGEMNLVGLIVTPVLTDGWGFSKPEWIETAHAARREAEQSGLRMDRIPPITVGTEAESEKAGEGKDSAGARLYIRLIHEQFARDPQRPLIVNIGGQGATLASAYTLDPSIADQCLVYYTDLRVYNGHYAWASKLIAKHFRVVSWGDDNWWITKPRQNEWRVLPRPDKAEGKDNDANSGEWRQWTALRVPLLDHMVKQFQTRGEYCQGERKGDGYLDATFLHAWLPGIFEDAALQQVRDSQVLHVTRFTARNEGRVKAFADQRLLNPEAYKRNAALRGSNKPQGIGRADTLAR